VLTRTAIAAITILICVTTAGAEIPSGFVCRSLLVEEAENRMMNDFVREIDETPYKDKSCVLWGNCIRKRSLLYAGVHAESGLTASVEHCRSALGARLCLAFVHPLDSTPRCGAYAILATAAPFLRVGLQCWATGPWKEVSALSKTICRPEVKGKPGPKTVKVPAYARSTPKPIKKDCAN
jgi:hypothetical protein